MLCLMQLGQSWPAGQKVLCAMLLGAQLATKARGQEAVQVPQFQLVAALLQVLVAERNCKNVALDPGTFNRYLTDHGIDTLMLSRAGPYSAEVVDMRRKLRRTFDRHNKEACDTSFVMFGPNGTKIPDLLKRP
jgi:hypothetical protein